MAKHLQVVCAVLVMGAASASSQSLTPRTPGLWQIDSTVTMAPIGRPQKHSEKLCVTPEMAKRDVAPPNALAEDGSEVHLRFGYHCKGQGQF